MYCGIYQLGDEITLAATMVNGDKEPSAPDVAPFIDFWLDGTTEIETKRMAPILKYTQTGIFAVPLFLGFKYSVGNYAAVIRYAIDSVPYQIVLTFTVAAGGDQEGAIMYMREYRKVTHDFVMQHLHSGRIRYGRNPRIE